MDTNTLSPAPEINTSISKVMRKVLYALVPGIALMVWMFGWGVLTNILLATLFCIILETLALKMRGRDIGAGLSDYSAVVTAWLLAIALPPLMSWWILLIGCFFAIAVAKHLYGGLGNNPFNPAMVGYVVLLISYPLAMTQWLTPSILGDSLPNLSQSMQIVFGGKSFNSTGIDAISMATPLDTVKTQLGLSNTLGEIRSAPLFGQFAGAGWEWVAVLFSLGGLYLVQQKIIPWQTPLALIMGMGIMASFFWLAMADHYPPPTFHILTTGTILGAFYIATDPVSGCSSIRGRVIFAAGVGILAYIIRAWGGYPDGIAFGVLLMNMAAPMIDHYTIPKSYGNKT